MNKEAMKANLESVLGKPYMYLTELTAEELMADDVRNYNPAEWDKVVGRYLLYKSRGEVQFYKWAKEDSPYDYDKFYVVYTSDGGIRFLNEVSYGGCITSTGLIEVAIDPTGGLRRYFFGENRDQRADKSNSKNREYFARMSRERGCIFTSVL